MFFNVCNQQLNFAESRNLSFQQTSEGKSG